MKLENIECYGTPEGEVMISESNKPVKMYDSSYKEFTDLMIDKISVFYPGAFNALSETYSKSKINHSYFSFLMIHRFIRCNFIKYDNVQDIDQNGVFRFEFVSCPLRGECKYCGIICQPKFNTSLSEREKQVMALFYNSCALEDIADKLFISILTVKKHKRNSLAKLQLHSLTDFISYASKNKMFEND